MIDISRKEIKYAVGPREIARIKQRLAPLMKSDSHNGINGYIVRSLYFDTPYDTDFEEKVDGYDNRKKIRLRVYDPEADYAKLELKEKAGTAQRKRSLLLNRAEAEQMIRGEYGFLKGRKEELASGLYVTMTKKCYRPKCIVEYDRFAYYLDHNETRITFDTGLRAGEGNFNIFDKNLILYPVSGAGESTLEVKYSGFLFTYIKNELSPYEKMPVSNSKYCRARMVSKRGRR